MKKKIIAANWKLNKSPSEATQFITDFKNLISNDKSFQDRNEILIFPSAFALDALSKAVFGLPIQFGPQNIFSEKSGAFTGENSAEVAKSLGAQFNLIGHSERRQLFAETDLLLNQKIKLSQALQMTPVFCIGESLQQREAHETEAVCFSHLKNGLADVNLQARLIIAYEPIWAIGTGKVATAAQVAGIHAQLFQKLTEMGFQNFQLLYGGSVKPDNAKELLNIAHVDGFLVGGASLSADSFFKICS